MIPAIKAHLTLLVFVVMCRASFSMNEGTWRVVWCPDSLSGRLTGQRYDTLGTSGEGLWIACPDETVIRFYRKKIVFPLLYFSWYEYRQAVRDLTTSQIEEVIQKRRQYWAPNALNQSINLLYTLEKRGLSLTSMALHNNKNRKATLHFDRHLDWVAYLIGKDRSADATFPIMYTIILESEAKLVKELEEARKLARCTGNTKVERSFGTAIRTHKEFTSRMAEILEKSSDSITLRSLPCYNPSRAFFIRPAGGKMARILKAQHIPSIEWNGGVVAPLSFRYLSQLAGDDSISSTVLYIDKGNFISDLHDLTPVQLNRELKIRLKQRPDTSLTAVNQFLNILRLELNLLKRNLRSIITKNRPELNHVWENIIDEDTRLLKKALAQQPILVGEAITTSADISLHIKNTEETLIREMRFFRALCKFGEVCDRGFELDEWIIKRENILFKLP